MMKINFITNLSLNETSGGWSGISARTLEQLSRFYNPEFIGPINPGYPFAEKSISKILRLAGFKGDFTFFASSRLREIERLYLNYRNNSARLDFFHGATPWILCKPVSNYVAYIDATFRTYINIYSDNKSFAEKHINRIALLEEKWLKDASAIFFGSNWAKNIAINEYGLNKNKCHVIWVGGNVPVPQIDQYDGGYKFLFISLDFISKGGVYCVKAFQLFRNKYPNSELLIIGQKPSPEILSIPGVKYIGFLRKHIENELSLFQALLAKARGLVHPTSMDTMGMVLIEAGYYGCPSIATRQFGIPELIKDKSTGYLLNLPISVDQIAEFMEALCQNEENYILMRKATKHFTSTNLTWDAFGNRIYEVINKII